MEGFFEYSCEYWDEMDKKLTIAVGVVYAEKYSEAIRKIEDYYGKENINSVTVTGLEPSEIYEFK